MASLIVNCHELLGLSWRNLCFIISILRKRAFVAESKVDSYDAELSSLKLQIKELNEKLDGVNERAKSFEREAKILEQEKIHLEQKHVSEFKGFDQVQERCIIAEREASRATEVADKARAEAGTAQKEKSEMQRLAMERLAQIERAERQIEKGCSDPIWERHKNDLADENMCIRDRCCSKVALLEARVEERERNRFIIDVEQWQKVYYSTSPSESSGH
ncbi:uncharacterized protein LOC115990549 [Quercus lobata]|uniref:uncharacterized protein LOC115990549 n=1 Tax=Quercus lobata TaxID=97700 RepID=UPI00124855BE|nr:uncharacterized protein LOC115990549 [Quercus lobata]